MTQKLQNIRGMNDILPTDTPLWVQVETTVRKLLSRYAYSEIRLPLVESTELFQRSIGEVTDIVEKEMFTFSGRGEENNVSMTLRPEATAGIVRAGIQHGLLYNQTQRLWTIGPMFRYEKPQKGRSRQFHQLDVEAFGLEGPDIDAELIALSARLWQELGISKGLRLHLNSLGSSAARVHYRELLISYFERYKNDLDEDSQARLYKNPLRILDSKNPAMAALVADAPVLLDHLDAESKAHFEKLQALLDALGIEYTLNSRLVRGLDYYNRTVFEWMSEDHLGAQNTVCGGGRYDGLVAHLGGRATAGIGFAIGLERLLLILSETDQGEITLPLHAYLVRVGEAAEQRALVLAETLRERLPELRLQLHCGSSSLKSQFRAADRSGAQFALILAEDEISRGCVSLKPLRGDGEQQSLSEAQLLDFLAAQLAHTP
ncbi:MAG: histidine--tRNA ligase [Candidatus Competibacteraceae bacterium]|nr:histidine--tRNA ligase [Candidatus Competibacteraceae bacterium]MCB1806090.1 histidine--tRNA ligase [Candidatus Competibacteraceae bacterium]MCB1810585.1 histidine--tRNA ligase [Candidatus Competibacteraceae bacterium]